jgi:hypothetical protein
LPDDRAVGDIECGKERGRPVARVIVGKGRVQAGLSSAAGPTGCGPKLNLALFIAAKDQRMLRRLEIESDDVRQLFGKVRIVGDLESPAQMRLESVLLPDAANRGGFKRRSKSAAGGAPPLPPACPGSAKNGSRRR